MHFVNKVKSYFKFKLKLLQNKIRFKLYSLMNYIMNVTTTNFYQYWAAIVCIYSILVQIHTRFFKMIEMNMIVSF